MEKIGSGKATLAAGQSKRHEIGHVVAGGKAPLTAQKDDGANTFIGTGLLQGLDHGAIHRIGDGVLLVRPIEADDLHSACGRRAFEENRIGRHGFPLSPEPHARRQGFRPR